MEQLIEKSIEDTLSDAFLEYAGYNLQRRAIPDVRDGLKWGARQLLHAQMLGKFTYDKPFKKAIKSVSQSMGFSYVHGEASAYGTFIRMAKPFVMNVPLQEAVGNYGTLIDPGDHSASRYVEMRGSEAAAYLLKDLNKDTIDEWEDTYDLEGEKQYISKPNFSFDDLNNVLKTFIGKTRQIPPKYSAIKKNGKKLCDLARKNKDINISDFEREIEIYSIELIDFKNYQAIIKINCKKGTYIRSLVNDIGEKLGCGACLIELKRTKAGDFLIQNSNNLDDEYIKINPLEVLNYPKIELNDNQLMRVLNGNAIQNETKITSDIILLDDSFNKK